MNATDTPAPRTTDENRTVARKAIWARYDHTPAEYANSLARTTDQVSEWASNFRTATWLARETVKCLAVHASTEDPVFLDQIKAKMAEGTAPADSLTMWQGIGTSVQAQAYAYARALVATLDERLVNKVSPLYATRTAFLLCDRFGFDGEADPYL